MSNTEITRELVEDNYEFKLLKKTLKKSYKWVKDLVCTDDPNKFSRIIFLDLVINPFELAEIEGLHVARYVKEDEPSGRFISLSVFFVENNENPSISRIQRDIDSLPKKISSSPHLPSEYKLKNLTDKIFNIDGFIYMGEDY